MANEDATIKEIVRSAGYNCCLCQRCFAVEVGHTGVEGARRLILKLLLPGVNLVRMELVALRKIRERRLLPKASSAIFAFSPARSVVSLAGLHISLCSQKRGPLHSFLVSQLSSPRSPPRQIDVQRNRGQLIGGKRCPSDRRRA